MAVGGINSYDRDYSGIKPRMSGRSRQPGSGRAPEYPSAVAPDDLAHYGAAYWQDFYDNCLVIGLVYQK